MKLKRYLSLILFYCLISVLKSQSSQQSACLTPTNDVGRCINILDCQSIIDTIDNRPVDDELKLELRKYFCGYEGSRTMVCCPLKEILSQQSNRGNLLPTKDCGEAEALIRIVNGERADLLEFPWQVALKYKTKNANPFKCGGTLINNRYVLTAAHCVTLTLNGVRLGEYDFLTPIDCVKQRNITTCAPAHQDFDITPSSVLVHPQYKTATKGYDIALIRLPRDAIFNEAVKPICLPINQSLTPKSLTNLLVTGWGYTETGKTSTILLKTSVPYKENDVCSSQIPVKIHDNQLCAGNATGQDTCNGDSGGPIMTTMNIEGRIKTIQVGLVSFGPTRCGEYYPGVYTRLTSFTKWIMDNVKP